MIQAGDTLVPPEIDVASGVAVKLTVVSRDGKAHSVLVRTAPAHPLHVPAGGSATISLPVLPDGRYVIEIDRGAGAGSLVVGPQAAP